jgi:ATP-dependent DNA helicase RecQ
MLTIEEENEESDLLILLAPMASGKTHFILSLIKENRGQWIYFSPLKALAKEIEAKMANTFPTYLYQKSDHPTILRSFIKKTSFLMIITEHQWSSHLKNELQFYQIKPTCIWDEFHLLYLWGDEFRPKLWDIFYEWAQWNILIIGLTATLSSTFFQEQWPRLGLGLSLCHLSMQNNFSFRYPPQDGFMWPKWSRPFFRSYLFWELFWIKKTIHQGSILLFVRTRNEVFQYVSFFTQRGVSVLGCVGGETEYFQKELDSLQQKNSLPHLIVSTTCLSHGVNLPSIRLVAILYQETQKELFFQMLGRGGRQGEHYTIHLFKGDQNHFPIFHRPYKRPISLSFFQLMTKPLLSYLLGGLK